MVRYAGLADRLGNKPEESGLGMLSTDPADPSPGDYSPNSPIDSLKIYFRDVERFSLLGEREADEFIKLEELKRNVIEEMKRYPLFYSKVNRKGRSRYVTSIMEKGNKVIYLPSLEHVVGNARDMADDYRKKRRGKKKEEPKEVGMKRADLFSLDRRLGRLYSKVLEKRNYITSSNLKLVAKIANRYKGTLPKKDLIQEGNLGLMRAVEKFDYMRHNKLSTYAVWWIEQSIIRAIIEKRHAIRLPVYLADRKRTVDKAIRILSGVGEEPAADSISELTGMTETMIKEILALPKVVSMEMEINPNPKDEGEGLSLDDVLGQNPDQDDVVLQHEKADLIRCVLGSMDPRERKIIMKRFGLDARQGRYDNGQNLQQIGNSLNVCRERARQLQEKVLGRLRDTEEGEKLRELI